MTTNDWKSHGSSLVKKTSVSSKSLWRRSCRFDFSDGFLWRISEALDSEIFRRKLDQCEWASSWRMQPAVGVLKSQRSQTALSLSWRMGYKGSGPVNFWFLIVTHALTCSLVVVRCTNDSCTLVTFCSTRDCTALTPTTTGNWKTDGLLQRKYNRLTEERRLAAGQRETERKLLDRHSDSGKFLGKPSIVMKTGFNNLTHFLFFLFF